MVASVIIAALLAAAPGPRKVVPPDRFGPGAAYADLPFVVIRPGAELRSSAGGGVTRVHFPAISGDAAPVYVARKIEIRGDAIHVVSVARDAFDSAQERHCGVLWGEGAALSGWVDRADLIEVATARGALERPDGSGVEVRPGTPIKRWQDLIVPLMDPFGAYDALDPFAVETDFEYAATFDWPEAPDGDGHLITNRCTRQRLPRNDHVPTRFEPFDLAAPSDVELVYLGADAPLTWADGADAGRAPYGLRGVRLVSRQGERVCFALELVDGSAARGAWQPTDEENHITLCGRSGDEVHTSGVIDGVERR